MLSATRCNFLGGVNVSTCRPFVVGAPKRAISIENAQKKGGGSTKNGRDSQAKRRGVKVYGGQPVKAGGIIVRQVGATWYPGENCDFGKDYTVFSKVEGIVVFEKKAERSRVSVYPADHPKAVKMIEVTHTTKKAEGELNRRQRKLLTYKPRNARTQ